MLVYWDNLRVEANRGGRLGSNTNTRLLSRILVFEPVINTGRHLLMLPQWPRHTIPMHTAPFGNINPFSSVWDAVRLRFVNRLLLHKSGVLDPASSPTCLLKKRWVFSLLAVKSWSMISIDVSSSTLQLSAGGGRLVLRLNIQGAKHRNDRSWDGLYLTCRDENTPVPVCNQTFLVCHVGLERCCMMRAVMMWCLVMIWDENWLPPCCLTVFGTQPYIQMPRITICLFVQVETETMHVIKLVRVPCKIWYHLSTSFQACVYSPQ